MPSKHVMDVLGFETERAVGQRHRFHRGEHGDGLVEDLLEPVVPHHRSWQLRQDPADEPHRPREEVEQRDEADQALRA